MSKSVGVIIRNGLSVLIQASGILFLIGLMLLPYMGK